MKNKKNGTYPNEYIKIVEKYFDGNTLLIANNKRELKKVMNILLNIEQYGDNNKGPDLISKNGNIIYGIEHFEIDSTIKTKKGSLYRKQLANVDENLEKELLTKNEVCNLTPLILNQDLKTYVKNFTETFNDHYLKIESYNNNLLGDFKNSKIELWFFIEDTTPFGNHYISNNDEPQLFTPAVSPEILNLFEKNNQVKGIIFATKDFNNQKKIYFYKNKKSRIKKLKKNAKKENVTSLLKQNPIFKSHYKIFKSKI